MMLSLLFIAAAATPCTPPATVAGATCPQIFGDAKDAAMAEARLTELGLLVAPGGACDDIFYSEGTLDPPTRVSFANAALVATQTLPACRALAVVHLSDALSQKSGCPVADYTVGGGGRIGRKNVVVSIFDGGVVLLREGKLRVLTIEGIAPPVFRMVWQSKWRLPRPTTPSGPAASTGRRP